MVEVVSCQIREDLTRKQWLRHDAVIPEIALFVTRKLDAICMFVNSLGAITPAISH
jgi:hypothetical protein